MLFSHLAIFLFLIHSTHIQNIVTPGKNNTQNNLILSLIIVKYKKRLTLNTLSLTFPLLIICHFGKERETGTS